jgi:AraC-like DNA-binding protein
VHQSDGTAQPSATKAARDHEAVSRLQSKTVKTGSFVPLPRTERGGGRLDPRQSSRTVDGRLRTLECVDAVVTRAGQRTLRSGLALQLAEFINANLGASLAIPMLAAQVHLSTYHFARVFKRTTGVTPHQFIIHLRLAAAAQFLAWTALPIADIAYRTGFSSQSQLAKLFRRWMGLTPIEYRRSTRAGRRAAEGWRATFSAEAERSSKSKNVVAPSGANASGSSGVYAPGDTVVGTKAGRTLDAQKQADTGGAYR